MLGILKAVLDEAHAGHEYISDQEKYGLPDYWAADLHGDCEDFALWIRQRLAQEDIECDLILCRTETGEMHMVASVDGWILDNRTRGVYRKEHIKYEWIALGDPQGNWFMIDGES